MIRLLPVWERLLLVFGFLLLFSGIAHSATKITVNCTPPTARIDGSVFAASDIGEYLFQLTQPSQPLQSLGNSPSCSYVYNIPVNTCVKAGSVFGASVSDKLGVWSDPGTANLMVDACNTLPKPAKPTVTITIQ